MLSPQFLLWLIPLVPLVRGRRGLAATALLTLALVLTQVWFPRRYWDYVGRFHRAGVVFSRDLALVALLAVLAWPSGLRHGPECLRVSAVRNRHGEVRWRVRRWRNAVEEAVARIADEQARTTRRGFLKGAGAAVVGAQRSSREPAVAEGGAASRRARSSSSAQGSPG